MKLKTLIERLQKVEKQYKKKYGSDPCIWDWDCDGLRLCLKIKRPSPGCRMGIKPYLERKTGIEKLF